MRPVLISVCLLLCLYLPAAAAPAAKMRPYSGIGVLQLPPASATFTLYDEPGLARCCTLDNAGLQSLTGWLFGTDSAQFLLVTARKGDWLEVEYDDAGRTGWLKPERSWRYTPWEQFLKGRFAVFLKNAPPAMKLLLPRSGAAEGAPLIPRQPMKVILADRDWAYVLLDQNSAGWIRWRDSDGRLLIGLVDAETK